MKQQKQKGVSVCPVTLDMLALGIELDVISCCVAVSAHAALCVVGCCTRCKVQTLHGTALQ